MSISYSSEFRQELEFIQKRIAYLRAILATHEKRGNLSFRDEQHLRQELKKLIDRNESLVDKIEKSGRFGDSIDRNY